MLTGRQTLQELNQVLSHLRNNAGQFEQTLASSSARLGEIQLEENRVLSRLAELRLEGLDAERLMKSFTRAEQSVLQTLQDRDRALGRMNQDIDQCERDLQQLEAQREQIHEQVDAAAARVAEFEAAAQQVLERNSAYQAQLERARVAEGIAQQAEEKTQLAVEDRLSKGAPYDADPLFRYLWKRKYGVSGYEAGGLVRMLDDWVAGICGYAEARSNYYMLQEIPKRLKEHATAVRYQAEGEIQRLDEWESAAAEQAQVPAAQSQLAAAEADQDECDDRIDSIEMQLRELRDMRNRFAVGEDEYSLRSLEILSEAYRRQDIERLSAMALQTLSDEDDALVMQLRDRRRERSDLRAALEEQKVSRQRYVEQLNELEDVRRKFKRNRYDDLRSSFGNEDLIQGVLREFLRGAVTSGGVWDTLRRQQRYRDVGGAWPDFGSGGFGRGGRRGPWHWPGGRGGFRIPSSGGSRSRGGFRTGGGF
ncbi:MAG: hypothetical protein AB8B93_14650 [Pseudomonadales bacterium]